MGEIKSIDRSIPKEIEEKFSDMLNQGIVALNLGDYTSAELVFKEQLSFLLDYQKKIKHPIHKGSPFYNMGLAQFFMDNIQDALSNFILAYIEDILSTKFEYEDEAERLPAARILKDSFLFDAKILANLKIFVAKQKHDGKLEYILHPQLVLDEVSKIVGFNKHQFEKLCGNIPKREKPLVGFPQPRAMRVFIGTNYEKNASVIPVIKKAVLSRGFIPVIPAEYGTNPNNIHDEALVFLHTCGHAIIDITNPAGQFMEVERCLDYKVHTILVTEKPYSRSPSCSDMVSTTGFPIFPYVTHQQLYSLAIRFDTIFYCPTCKDWTFFNYNQAKQTWFCDTCKNPV